MEVLLFSEILCNNSSSFMQLLTIRWCCWSGCAVWWSLAVVAEPESKGCCTFSLPMSLLCSCSQVIHIRVF